MSSPLDTILKQALAHHQVGQLAEAEKLYRQVLSSQPDNAPSLHGLGLIACEVGQHREGIELIRRAVSLDPSNADYLRHLGQAFLETAAYQEAADVYSQLTQRDPTALDWTNLSIALRELRRYKRALAATYQAIALNPALALAYAAQGDILDRLRDFTAAARAYEKSIELEPAAPRVLDALATTFHKQGLVEQAVDIARRTVDCALSLYPPLDAADCFQELLFLLHYDPRQDGPSILAEHRRWDQILAMLRRDDRFDNDRSPDRRLRIGYVSPDFTNHPVGIALLPLFLNHDRQAFEITCYNDVLGPDAMTDKFRSLADHWRDIQNLSHAQLAQQIRADQIDLLIDMTGQTPRHRLQAFAEHPAPVQITYGGYPATTGLSAMDYRITDSFLDPPGQSESHNSETLLRLKGSFWCYSLHEPTPNVNQLPALTNGHITFGSLNNACKHTAPTLSAWASLLHQLPTSRLMILVNEADGQSPHLRREFERLQINPDRIQPVARKPRADYLSLYNQIDIALDPLTYNSHMTGCDALWMGVPLITLTGQTSVGRAGTSLLSNLGLTELIASNPEQYFQLATQLATDLPRLAQLRSSLRQRMMQSPLCHAPAYARDIERLYRTAWKNWCQGSQ